jgi:excisionase family DNA binding protein
MQLKPATLPIPAAVAYSGIGRTLLYELVARGCIRAVKAGRRTLLVTETIDRYLASLPDAQIGVSRRAA